ncbi:MAG TPA: SseB family protein [Micromonosporaceae bacterium]|jgi:hypothetical protein
MSPWEPVNEVERTLRHAWLHNDTVLYLRTIAAAPLYLPGFAPPGASPAGSDRPDPSSPAEGQRLLTWPRDGRTYLLVFTSPEALFQQLRGVVDGWRLSNMTELIGARPDPEWGIVINPNAPIGAYLDPDELDAMAELLADEPMFYPGARAEAVMFRAQRAARPGAYLDALLGSTVLVPLTAAATADDLRQADFPWLVEEVDGAPTLSAFTSDLRVAEAVSDNTPTVRVAMLALAEAWPDPSWRLTVNPRSAIAATFDGAQIPDLLAWARRHGVPVRDESRPSVADLLRGSALPH